MRIKLSENFRAILYAPFYATHALGSSVCSGCRFLLVGGLLWVMLCLIASPALAQQDEVGVLSRNVSELFAAGKFAQAVPLSQRVLAINESRLGPNHLIVANSLFNLASLYVNQGRYADAEPLYARALAIYEKVHGPTHASVADAMDSLATLYNYQGRYGDAEGLYRRPHAQRHRIELDLPYPARLFPARATALSAVAGLVERHCPNDVIGASADA